MDNELPVAISYSGGASSEWLIHAVIQGWLPRPKDLAVFFAATPEHDWTYERVKRVFVLCAANDIPFFWCPAVNSKGENLIQHLIALGAGGRTRADHPPIFIAKDGGRGRAQHRCTREFKVAPMRRMVSWWLKHIHRDKRVIKWIGFAFDEAHRATKALANQDVQWEQLAFPAVEARVTRIKQREQVKAIMGDVPRFSMCVFCPFKTPARWRATSPADLETAYAVDDAIRNLDEIGLTEGEGFLTDRLIPIRDLIKRGDPTPMLPGFDSYCDGGACFL